MALKDVTITLRTVYCYDTEDLVNDEFYAAAGTISSSDHSVQKSTVTTPLEIQSGHQFDFPRSEDSNIFSGRVPENDTISVGLTFFDADFSNADVPEFLDAAAAAVGILIGTAVAAFASAGAGAVAGAIASAIPRAITSAVDYIDKDDPLVTIEKVVSVGELENGVHEFIWNFNHEAGTIKEPREAGIIEESFGPPTERVDWSEWAYTVLYEIKVDDVSY